LPRIGEHIRRGYPDHAKSKRLHIGVAPLIGRLLLIAGCAVDLDDELGRRTIEIGDERSDGMLPAEAKIAPTEAQQSP
jgi:hypothetical protein